MFIYLSKVWNVIRPIEILARDLEMYPYLHTGGSCTKSEVTKLSKEPDNIFSLVGHKVSVTVTQLLL